jgi:hypothetical protein
MPRKSHAERMVKMAVTPNPIVEPRLPVPAELSPAERGLWAQVTSALPANFLKREQGELLVRYVRHATRARELDALAAACDPEVDLDRLAKLVQLAGSESRTALAFARSLRITNQARLKAETAAAQVDARPASESWADDELIDHHFGGRHGETN